MASSKALAHSRSTGETCTHWQKNFPTFVNPWSNSLSLAAAHQRHRNTNNQETKSQAHPSLPHPSQGTPTLVNLVSSCPSPSLLPVPHTSPRSGPAGDFQHPASWAPPAPGTLPVLSNPDGTCLRWHCTPGPRGKGRATRHQGLQSSYSESSPCPFPLPTTRPNFILLNPNPSFRLPPELLFSWLLPKSWSTARSSPVPRLSLHCLLQYT